MIYSLCFSFRVIRRKACLVSKFGQICALHSIPLHRHQNCLSPIKSPRLLPSLPSSLLQSQGDMGLHTHTHIFRPHFPFTLCCPSYLPYTFVLTLPTFFISPLLVPSPLFLTLSWLSSLFPCPSVSASPSRLCVLVRSHTPRGIFHPIYHIHSLPLLLD